MGRVQSVEERQAAQQRTVGNAIERRVEKRAKRRALVRPARNGSVKHVEQRGNGEKEAARPNVSRAVDDAADDRARGADRGDPHEPVRDRVDDAQIPCFNPVGENLHSTPRGRASRAKGIRRCATMARARPRMEGRACYPWGRNGRSRAPARKGILLGKLGQPVQLGACSHGTGNGYVPLSTTFDRV